MTVTERLSNTGRMGEVVASDVDIDADNVGRLPPSLRGASTSSDQPESRMSRLEMENKITLLTFEVDGLKKTIFEMRPHFDLEFSKLRATANKQAPQSHPS
ncbi:hypothetical protein POM88_001724 [Heracleum sosnowskyi]|uniref:Uncharacterized protein n=1 Tax=Heracleum sosnowskyi TaxID=360622 RepID=A0AAD8JER4_9APIA|nr:hypothetical protein POM88_001724 [Heracleum sosnowskyi]